MQWDFSDRQYDITLDLVQASGIEPQHIATFFEKHGDLSWDFTLEQTHLAMGKSIHHIYSWSKSFW